MNILVLEDDCITQGLLTSWLQPANSITFAVNCDEAWKLLKENSVDLVLGNCSRPESDSINLCRLIREDPDHAGCYVILYACDGLRVEADGLIGAGADDFLGSPLEEISFKLRLRVASRILSLRRVLSDQNTHLKSLVGKLKEAFQTIETDLQAASEIQLSLLPTISEVHPSLYVDWLVLPSSFLSGDNLNYFMMQERYLIFYHLDVAGHGIPSALLSVTLNQLLSPQPGSPMVRFDPQRDVKRLVPPADVVGELNRRFFPQRNGHFTMIYGILDTKTREVTFCQAGHPSPFKISQEHTVVPLGSGGFPVGLWPDMTYEETTTTLKPGEKMVLYSDGLPECLSSDGMPYSLQRLHHLLLRHTTNSVKGILRTIQADLQEWSLGRSFPDDISLLIIESK